VRAARFDVADLAARVVAVQDGRARLAGQPAVAPAGHDHQHVDELGALRGQVVLVPRAPVVRTALEHAVLDEVD
jgi:hypothetical protein